MSEPYMAGGWMCVKHAMTTNCQGSTDQCVVKWQPSPDEPKPPQHQLDFIREHCMKTGARIA